MRRFHQYEAKRPQRGAYKALFSALSDSFDLRGPFKTAHGWPYFLVDTPQQTLSVRTTKVGGRRIYVVYEGFGEFQGRQNSHQCYRDNVVEVVQSLIDKDVGRDFYESADTMLGIERAVDYKPENVKVYIGDRLITGVGEK